MVDVLLCLSAVASAVLVLAGLVVGSYDTGFAAWVWPLAAVGLGSLLARKVIDSRRDCARWEGVSCLLNLSSLCLPGGLAAGAVVTLMLGAPGQSLILAGLAVWAPLVGFLLVEWVGQLRYRLYAGSQFLFVKADCLPGCFYWNSGPRWLWRRTILTRHRRSYTLLGHDFEAVEEPVFLAAVVTDRHVYDPGDTARAVVVSFAGSALDLEASWNETIVARRRLDFRGGSVQVEELTELWEGEYEVRILRDTHVVDRRTFRVSPHSLSLLEARVRRSSLNDESTLTVEVGVDQLGEPYAGNLRVCLCWCDRVVLEQTVEALGGVATVCFEGLVHSSRLSLKLSTPQGDTAQLPLPGDAHSPALVGALGRNLLASTTTFPGSEEHRHLSYLEGPEQEDAPIVLTSSIASEAEMRFRDSKALGLVVVMDPVTRRSRTVRPRGGVARFAVRPPYVLVQAAVWSRGQEPYESFGVVVCPPHAQLRLKVPPTAAPGEEIEVAVQGEGTCVLVACDARLAQDEPPRRLASRMISHQWAAAQSSHTGPVKRFETHFTSPWSRWGRHGPDGTITVSLGADSGRSSLQLKSAPARSRSPSPVEADPEPIRTDFRKLLAFEVFPLKGELKRTLRLGEAIGNYRVCAYLFQAREAVGAQALVASRKEVFVEADLPAVMGWEDEAQAVVRYVTPAEGELVITTARDTRRQRVEGRGSLEFPLRGPGEVIAELVSPAGSDRMSRVIEPPGKTRSMASRLQLLRRGEQARGRQVRVYPDSAFLSLELVRALVDYPFGCAEQTSSKLFGLAYAYRAYRGSPRERARVEALIRAGLGRMKRFYFSGGGFSFWERDDVHYTQPRISVSGQVLRNLAPYRALPFPEVQRMLDETAALMLEEGVRDNRLLTLSKDFAAPLSTNQDAVALYFAGRQRQECLELLRHNAQPGAAGIHWTGEGCWGGSLEMTCDALRVMADAGDPLFEPGFRHLSHKLVDGRLYSTADTRALLELMGALDLQPCRQIELDGSQIAPGEAVTGSQVRALDGDLLIRIDEEIEVDLLEPRENFVGRLDLSDSRIRRGQRVMIEVRPGEDSLCPLARIFLPGSLALLEGGAQAQTAYLPVKAGRLEVCAVGVRRGTGQVQATLCDMYDGEKVGLLQPVPISVD